MMLFDRARMPERPPDSYTGASCTVVGSVPPGSTTSAYDSSSSGLVSPKNSR